MKSLITMISKFLMVGVLTLGVAMNAHAQRVVSGTVTASDDGEPLVGVSIVIAGTATGATTNIDGEYQIEASDSDQLVFSMVGFQTYETIVGDRSTIDVEMEVFVGELDEVVVTAFGLRRDRKALGYSIQQVEGTQLSTAREMNVANSLQGRMAGVDVNRSATPGGSSSVIIRGASSLSGDNQPLYVVDGFPINNSNLDAASIAGGRDFGDGIGNIQPDDIESMTVLKGPTAAALYGSRGANGVIMITTKEGATDRDQVEVTVNTGLTFDLLNVTPTYQNTYGAGYGGGTIFGTTVVDGVEVDMMPDWGWDHWGAAYDGRPYVLQTMPEAGILEYSAQPRDNVLELYRTGITANNSISFSGGTQTTNYRLSMSDMRNQHILPVTNLERQSVSLNVSSAVYDNLVVHGRVHYINQQGENRPEAGFGRGAANLAATLAETPRHIDLALLTPHMRPDGSQVNPHNRIPNNPYWIMHEMVSEDQRRRIIGNLTLSYDATEWLNMQARGGTDFYNDTRFERVAPGTHGAINGWVENNDWSVREDYGEFMMTTDGELTSDFDGSFTAGASHTRQERQVRGFRGNNLISPRVYDISNAQDVRPRNSISRKEINSVFGMAQLAFRNYLFLDLTGRNDWSSTLSRDNYSFFYPSATMSFSYSDLLNIDPAYLTYGKLRVSVAQAGNDAEPYMTTSGYTISPEAFQGARFASGSNTIPLVDLKNELTTSLEIGTEMRLVDNRVGIDFTWYRASTKNQILPIEISNTSGYSSRLINAGEVMNKGIELMLNVIPVRTQTFMWDATLNMSRNRSEVVELVDELESFTLMTQAQVSIEARPGEPFGNLIGFEYLRTEDGRLLLNDNGQHQRAPETSILGNIQPDMIGGFENTFSYRGFHLSALIDFSIGGEVMSTSMYRQMANGTGVFTVLPYDIPEENEFIIDGVIEQEDGTYVQSDVGVNRQNLFARRAWGGYGEAFIVDKTYSSLREVTFGYQFGDRLIRNIPVSSARFSIVARNLFYLYRADEFKEMGIAPEGIANTSPAAMGYETKRLPTTRSIGFNLQFSL